jgi:3',5'-cyclic AMP phosphodiesterase CpdA
VTSARFAVLSDPHLHDAAALGASGPEFEAYVAQDRKMIAESAEILDAAVADLKAASLDFASSRATSPGWRGRT